MIVDVIAPNHMVLAIILLLVGFFGMLWSITDILEALLP